MELLIRRGQPVDIRDPGYDATPLAWALYDWRTSRLQECFDHPRELGLRIPLLHKTSFSQLSAGSECAVDSPGAEISGPMDQMEWTASVYAGSWQRPGQRARKYIEQQ